LDLVFLERPPLSTSPISMSLTYASARGSSTSITQRSDRRNSFSPVTPGLYSRLVLVPMKTDGMRPVIRTTKTKQVGYSVEFVVNTSYS
jgi:hypothetical protein